MKRINSIIFIALAFAACTSQTTNNKPAPVLKDWQDSLSCRDLDPSLRIQLADSLIHHSHWDDEDSIVYRLLTPDMLDATPFVSPSVILDKANDGRALMLTFRGGGTMCTGTTYMLYRMDNGSTVFKKVAYAEQCEEGGVAFPPEYRKIEAVDGGYYLLGRFSFSTTDDVFEDTMMVSKDSLEEEWHRTVLLE